MAGGRSSAGKRQSAWEDRALDRVRQQALQRGHRIVQAARRIVAEGGLDALTLRAVLDKAGLARRAFYRHFAAMDDLLLALFEDTVRHGCASSWSRSTNPSRRSSTPCARSPRVRWRRRTGCTIWP